MPAVFVLVVAVAPTTRDLTSRAATFVLFVFLVSSLLFLRLVEASGHFIKPAVWYLVGAVHNTAQHELLHVVLSMATAERE